MRSACVHRCPWLPPEAWLDTLKFCDECCDRPDKVAPPDDPLLPPPFDPADRPEFVPGASTLVTYSTRSVDPRVGTGAKFRANVDSTGEMDRSGTMKSYIDSPVAGTMVTAMFPR